MTAIVVITTFRLLGLTREELFLGCGKFCDISDVPKIINKGSGLIGELITSEVLLLSKRTFISSMLFHLSPHHLFF